MLSYRREIALQGALRKLG